MKITKELEKEIRSRVSKSEEMAVRGMTRKQLARAMDNGNWLAFLELRSRRGYQRAVNVWGRNI